METIVATAFGRVVDIQGGENDQLTTAADLIFRGAEEGNSTSGVVLIPLISKHYNVYPRLINVFFRQVPILGASSPVCYVSIKERSCSGDSADYSSCSDRGEETN